MTIAFPVNAAHEVNPMNGGNGAPSTITFTSVRGCETLKTFSGSFHAPFNPVTRSTVAVSSAPKTAVAHARHATLIASRFIHTYLGWLIAGRRHGTVESIEFRHK